MHTQKTWSFWWTAGNCGWLLRRGRGDVWFDTLKGQRLNDSIFTFLLALLSSYISQLSTFFFSYSVKGSCPLFLCLTEGWLALFSWLTTRGRLPECLAEKQTRANLTCVVKSYCERKKGGGYVGWGVSCLLIWSWNNIYLPFILHL